MKATEMLKDRQTVLLQGKKIDPYVEATQVKLKALREEPHTDLLFSTAYYSRRFLILYNNFNISNDFHPDMSYASSISFFHIFFRLY